MRPEDLHLSELLEPDPDGGVLRFAGQRALLLDAVAMGLLRDYLHASVGAAAMRAVLTQFGFAHGWRMAEALRESHPSASVAELLAAGPRVFALQGLFLAQPAGVRLGGPSGTTLLASYEAEQHLLHLGRSEESVCWTICGLLSGFTSRLSGESIYVLEDRCLGMGQGACHLVGRTREEWGEDHADDLVFYERDRLHDCLEVSLNRVTESLKAAEAKLHRHRKALVHVVPELDAPLGIVARSKPMQLVVALARRIATVDATVLITGESGVGKERIARLLHDESTRSGGPFIAVNCGAISETLLESELFGHARGAFTGAVSDRPGLFEAANGGTLLLDEIGEVSPAVQVKLLRVLQEREVRRVGENRSRSVNVRVLAATNRDLVAEMAGGSFRSDLYYRLKVVQLHVPPLRDRPDDVLPLARVLLAESAVRMVRPVTGLSSRAADQLLRYPWPGNVRELANAMERAVALAPSGRVELDDLPEAVRLAGPGPLVVTGGVRPLRDVEKEYILAALDQNDGHQTRTAKQLGIGTATLYRKLKKYGKIQGRAR